MSVIIRDDSCNVVIAIRIFCKIGLPWTSHLRKKPPTIHTTTIMFSPRAIVSPLARVAFKPQTVRITARPSLLRVQAMSASTVSEAITKDHRELEQYYNEIVKNPDDIDHITRYGNQFTWELARHSVAEELLIYPAMEKYMGEEGKQHAESDRKQHHQVSSCNQSIISLY